MEGGQLVLAGKIVGKIAADCMDLTIDGSSEGPSNDGAYTQSLSRRVGAL